MATKYAINYYFDTKEELDAHVAAVNGASSGESTPANKPAAGKGKPPAGPSRESVVAAATTLKEKSSAADVRAINLKVGGKEKLAEVPDAKLGAVLEAINAKIAELDEAAAGGDDDGV